MPPKMPPKSPIPIITLQEKVYSAAKLAADVKKLLTSQRPPIAETDRVLRLIKSIVDEVWDTLHLHDLEKGERWICLEEADGVVDSRMRILVELWEAAGEVVAEKGAGQRVGGGTGEVVAEKGAGQRVGGGAGEVVAEKGAGQRVGGGAGEGGLSG